MHRRKRGCLNGRDALPGSAGYKRTRPIRPGEEPRYHLSAFQGTHGAQLMLDNVPIVRNGTTRSVTFFTRGGTQVPTDTSIQWYDDRYAVILGS